MNAWAKNMTKTGFTVIELLIVIVVIGILTTILFVGYGAVQNSAQDTAFKAELTKVGDSIKLINLDNNNVAAGGATSLETGDSTVLPGVTVSPDKKQYDLTTLNLFYCSGDVDGSTEFALIAKSKRGMMFYYKSNSPVAQLDSSTDMTYDSVCPAVGFSDPYTWSYGYNPSVQYGWLAWANGSAPTITNIGVNPRNFPSTWLNNNPAIWTTTPATVSSNPSGITTAVKSQIKVGQVDPALLSVYNVDGLLNSSTPRSVGVWAYVTTSGYEAYLMGPTQTTHVPLNANTWTYVKSTFALTGYVTFAITTTSGGGANSSDFGYATGAMTVAGSQAYDYRDGYSVGWTWSGTAGVSTSSGPSPL